MGREMLFIGFHRIRYAHGLFSLLGTGLGIFFVSGAVLGCSSKVGPQGGSEIDDPTPRIPLEEFLREPEVHTRRLSPDGESYSFLTRVDGNIQLLVRSLPTGIAVNRSPDREADIREYLWLPQGRLLSVVARPEGNFAVFLTTPGSWGSSLLVSGSGSFEILDPLPSDSNGVAVLYDGTGEGASPHRLELVTGKLDSLPSPNGDIEKWVFDHDGELRCVLREEGLQNSLLCRSPRKAAFRTVLAIDAVRDLLLPVGFSTDNRLLIAYSNLGRERIALVTVDPETGQETGLLFEDPRYDLFGDDESDHVRFSNSHGELSYAFYTTWRRTYRFFDTHTEGVIRVLEDRFPDHVIRLVSASADESSYLVKVSGDRLAGEYYLFDVESSTTTFLDSDCPWLREEELAPKRPIEFRVRDGTTVHGYLVLPPGRAATNIPLVVYPHGGPQWRDVWEMGRFREVQLLANRGYGVLLVNFRGSTGFGKTFLTEGFKENGLTVQDDITDGVRHLVSEGIADPSRIAIIGGSYGGFAVLAGLAFTPDLYACGVDLFGVSNFFTFLDALSHFTDMSVMYERVGHPERDKDLLTRTSPLFHVDNIRVPVLVAQGGRDPVVNRAESDQIVAALQLRGVPVTYVFHEDEGHGYFSRGDNWLELWRSIEGFLASHLGEKGP